MNGGGTLQIGQSRGVLLWTRCSETERCGFHMYIRNTKMCYGIQPCKWQNSNNTPTMQASKHDCFTSIRSNIYRGSIEEMEEFYEKVQHVVDDIPRVDVLIVCDRRLECESGTGRDKRHNRKIRTGERNERGDQLVEFCSRNDFQIMNTFFMLHARRLYTCRSPGQITNFRSITSW